VPPIIITLCFTHVIAEKYRYHAIELRYAWTWFKLTRMQSLRIGLSNSWIYIHCSQIRVPR